MHKFKLSDKDTIELRIKCFEPFVRAASIQNLDRLVYINQAEKAWEYAIAPLVGTVKKSPDESQPSSDVNTTAEN